MDTNGGRAGCDAILDTNGERAGCAAMLNTSGEGKPYWGSGKINLSFRIRFAELGLREACVI